MVIKEFIFRGTGICYIKVLIVLFNVVKFGQWNIISLDFDYFICLIIQKCFFLFVLCVGQNNWCGVNEGKIIFIRLYCIVLDIRFRLMYKKFRKGKYRRNIKIYMYICSI